MAKAKVIHSADACTMIFRGSKSDPEPSTGVIKFPGGNVEVSRCSDGSYWAHISLDDASNNIRTRVDYDYDKSQEHGILPVPDVEHIEHLAILVKGPFLEPGE